jgi:hypothetical protein
LTRWRHAGRISTQHLVERSGHGADLGRTALLRALAGHRSGLASVLPLDGQQAKAPRPGRFELDRGVLTTAGTNVTISAVHDLGLLPGEWGYEQSGQ